MMGPNAPDFGAASDGDGDRNMIVGRDAYVSPSDSLAVLAANAQHVPAYAGGLAGVARSMPTSGAADRVAEKLGIGMYETPTGWKFFGNLLDAGRSRSAARRAPAPARTTSARRTGFGRCCSGSTSSRRGGCRWTELMADHWASYGRNYYTRLDYEAVPTEAATALIEGVRDRLTTLSGQSFADLEVAKADEFSYRDPVDGSGQPPRRACASGTRAARARSFARPAPARKARRSAAIWRRSATPTSPIRRCSTTCARRRCSWPGSRCTSAERPRRHDLSQRLAYGQDDDGRPPAPVHAGEQIDGILGMSTATRCRSP